MSVKIGLIGDYIHDIYVYGECNRISPESPIPVFEEHFRKQSAGGSGNVEANLRALGSEVQHFHYENDEVISKKTRFVVDNHILFRTDNEHYVANYKTDINFDKDVKYVILSDYDKGFVHDPKSMIQYLKEQGKFVIVDPKKPLDLYKGADIVKLNQSELFRFGLGDDTKTIIKNLGCKALIVTQGRDGVKIYDHLGEYHIKTDEHQVSDVTGAGDVFVASFTYYLAKGLSIKDAAIKATKLASISVTKFGTYVLSQSDIRSVTPKVIFTNGCFDILHRGHVDYLKKSKELGDKLIVGLNSDKSVCKLKGLGRPVNNQEDRKLILENLGFVDEVVIFNEETPYELIKNIKPDIITKGGDYTVETVVGNDLAKVVIIPTLEGYSTSRILEILS